jgi:hypothetical protein
VLRQAVFLQVAEYHCFVDLRVHEPENIINWQVGQVSVSG